MYIHGSSTVRAAILAGAIALTIAGASSAFATQSDTTKKANAATEECLNWTGTSHSLPAVTPAAHTVTDVISGTLSNCNFEGNPQTFNGSFFAVLSGSASK